jgi:addiction module HigA family antidote
MVRVPKHRPPTHPGEVLREEFLGPMGLSQAEAARALGVPYQRLNEVVREARAVTPATALRLAKYFGTTAAFWMNLQLAVDLYEAERAEAEALAAIEPVAA